MGIDESIFEHMRNGISPATIRFYRWQPGAVSIGRFQSMEKEVNIKECGRLGVNYIRRITGGGAVYHDHNGEITYSIIAPEILFRKGIRESYRDICNYVVKGLSELGIKADFVPINDIVVDGKKISGNAQTRKEGVLLQHGTVLYDLNVRQMFTLLNVNKEKISDKMIKNVEERVTCVSRYKDIGIDALYSALLKGFTEGKEHKIGKLSESEMIRAKELSDKVYRTKEWNFSR